MGVPFDDWGFCSDPRSDFSSPKPIKLKHATPSMARRRIIETLLFLESDFIQKITICHGKILNQKYVIYNNMFFYYVFCYFIDILLMYS